jgi:hypothetical protein
VRSIEGAADYVYGTISTLVALAGLTFETHPAALTTAGIVVVGAVAIWFAHALSGLITQRSWQHLDVRVADVRRELEGSWPIVSAALPTTLLFLLAGVHVLPIHAAFACSDAVGVLGLAAVGVATAGTDRPVRRRLVYVGGLVSVGLTIVALESLVHLL